MSIDLASESPKGSRNGGSNFNIYFADTVPRSDFKKEFADFGTGVVQSQMHGAMITIESKKKNDRYMTNRLGELEYTITLKLYD